MHQSDYAGAESDSGDSDAVVREPLVREGGGGRHRSRSMSRSEPRGDGSYYVSTSPRLGLEAASPSALESRRRPAERRRSRFAPAEYRRRGEAAPSRTFKEKAGEQHSNVKPVNQADGLERWPLVAFREVC